LSKNIDLHNEVLNFSQKEGESLGAAQCRYNQLALSGPELSIPYAMFIKHLVHRLGTESAKYLDMTYGESLFIAQLRRGGRSWIESFWSLHLKICKSKLR
jgi:hypothetical protein